MVVTHQSGAEQAPETKSARRRKQKPVEVQTQSEEGTAPAPPSEPEPTPESQGSPASAPGSTPAPEPQPRTGGSRGKKRQAAPAAAPALTLGELADRYLEHLEAVGKSHGTLFSYGMEIRTACRELGAETLIAALTPERVAAYFESPRVTLLKSGRPKAKPSVDKTRRVLRLALVWAAECGWIERAPLPAVTEIE